MHFLIRHTLIPYETLDRIVDDQLPGTRKKKLIQECSVVLGFPFVFGGNPVYFRFFSTWKGLDPVNTTIYVIQVAVILSGPLLACDRLRAAPPALLTFNSPVAAVEAS
ncbi:MAG: hypothetical protein IH986_16950 [Planctomycetes bacterium]|nr:hypothetical protein [Planctomycetota bacterium]